MAKKGKRGTVGKANIKFSATRAVKLYQSGKSVPQIALAMGYPPGTGNNRTRAALVKAGVYSHAQTTTKKATPAAGPKAQRTRTAAPRATRNFGLGVPNDPETALKICLQTADVNAKKLNLDSTAANTFAKKLMAGIAANFGVQDFQVRKPVLVFDERAAGAHMMKVATA
jgi:hypothetical protein